MMKRYKIYCEVDSKWEYFDSLIPKLVCPVNPAHTVTTGSLAKDGKVESDYKVLRSNLITYVATTGFTNLSVAEKVIASEHFVVSKVDRDTVHTLAEQISNGVYFHEESVKARFKRRMVAEAEVYNRVLDSADQSDFRNDVVNLLELYVNFGIEGTVEGDDEGLFDYLESRSGTAYAGANGFLAKNYTIESMNISGLSARLIDVFKNGNY